jgi:hypothetical protein
MGFRCGYLVDQRQSALRRVSHFNPHSKGDTQMLTATTSTRSNRSIFVPRDTGSPNDGLLKHISTLGSIARLDFERCSVASDVIYAIEGDAMPTSQQDEEARVGTLAYALKKLNPTHVRPTAVASDSASTVRALGEVPHESRPYREK